MIIPLHTRQHFNSAPQPGVPQSFEVWAFTGDFSLFSLLYSVADAPDAPAFFAAELFDALERHQCCSVRDCELAIWADGLPLDARRWMFYATTERLSAEHLALLAGLTRGANGWSRVGRVPSLPGSAVPLYEYEKGTHNLLLSDVLVGESEKALAHPMVISGNEGLSLSFGVFPDAYPGENKLYLGAGDGICFRTKSAQRLKPKKVYRILAEKKEVASPEKPPAHGLGLRLV